MKAFFQHIILPVYTIKDNWDLYKQSMRREISQKYRGSYLGILWNFILPLVMMVVYSFIFGVVFKAKWDMQISDSNVEFALILYVGIALYTVFSESVSIAPTLILSNSNYVKKVVYPLEMLSFVNVGGALVQLFINVIIVIVAKIFIIGKIDLFFLLFPIIIIPLVFLTLGISWLLSALGVYVRDMKQASTIITLIFGYATPVFFPLSAVPNRLRWLMIINPITPIVENARKVLIYGIFPDLKEFIFSCIETYIIFIVGFCLFRRMKSGFADVM